MTTSWIATAKVPSFPKLQEDMNTEVCVIGAGIAGLTAAYLLCLEGKKVVVLEDGTIGSGETGRTTAHIVNAFDDRYEEMEKLHGEQGSKLIAESHTAAIHKIAHIVKHEKIDCEFRYLDGYLFVPPDESADVLHKELKAAKKAGLDVEMVARAPLEFDTGEAIRFPKQATFHPLKYLSGLAHAITRMGGKIYTGSHVSSIKEGQIVAVETSSKKAVYADNVIVATNSPINTWVKIHSKQAPYRTFVVAMHVPRGTVEDALFWDTADPYHYVRLQHVTKKGSKHDLLIVGGEDHKTGQEDDAEERFHKLEHWARERFRHLGKTEFRWSGQVMEPVDGVGYIGRSPGSRNVFMITGDSGNGMTHCTLGAMLVNDMIMGRENKWEKLYDPSRVNLRPGAAFEYAKENVNVAVQYADYVSGSDVDSTSSIKRGEGAVIQRGIHKLAVYRDDDDGKLHEHSAICTHLGCIVHWNSTEKTFDCPCHGSRFSPTGEVLNGPASAPLSPIGEEKEEQKEKEKAEA